MTWHFIYLLNIIVSDLNNDFHMINNFSYGRVVNKSYLLRIMVWIPPTNENGRKINTAWSAFILTPGQYRLHGEGLRLDI